MKRNKMDFDFNGRYARHRARVEADRAAVAEAVAKVREPEGVCRICGEGYERYADDFEYVCPNCEADLPMRSDPWNTTFKNIVGRDLPRSC